MRGGKRKEIKLARMGGGDHAELQRGGEGGGVSGMARVKGDHVTMKPGGREWVGETSCYAVGAESQTEIRNLAVTPTPPSS